MRTLIVLLALSSTAVAAPRVNGPQIAPPSAMRASPNLGYGYNYYDSRGYIGRSERNSFGGYNTYNQSNQLMGRTLRQSTGSYQIQRYNSYRSYR